MSRGLTDEPIHNTPNEAQNDEVTNIINELIKGQNKLHDRLIDLERKADHGCKDCKCKNNPEREAHSRSEAKRFKILGL